MNLQHEKASLLIITDAVIFHRIANKITGIMNIVIDESYKNQFHANECYNGFETAMILMGYEDDEYGHLRDTFREIAWDLATKEPGYCCEGNI